MRPRRHAALIALTLVAGCGAGHSAATLSAPTAPITTFAATTTPPFSDPQITAAVGVDYCTYRRELSTRPVTAFFPSNAAPAGIEQGLTAGRHAMDELARLAPDEIRADSATIAAAFTNRAEIYARYAYDTRKVTRALFADKKLLKRLADTEVELTVGHAATRLLEYEQSPWSSPDGAG